MEKAKRFQPLAVLNQKLKGLEVFESNENQQALTGASRPPGPSQNHPQTLTLEQQPRPLDPEDIITKEHWQPRGFYDSCLEPSCGQRLNATNGSVNCRKCGKLFCEEHTMYQMKLSRSAQHEPVRGLWYRVCETCYKSREGYNDHNGICSYFGLGKQILICGRPDKRPNGRVQSREEAECRQVFVGSLAARKAPDETHSATS